MLIRFQCPTTIKWKYSRMQRSKFNETIKQTHLTLIWNGLVTRWNLFPFCTAFQRNFLSILFFFCAFRGACDCYAIDVAFKIFINDDESITINLLLTSHYNWPNDLFVFGAHTISKIAKKKKNAIKNLRLT